ncbi:MAG: Magnesium and cobalt efflux protein CorC [Candidatus Izimaplasma bacterium HR2]|nr:MAG: Magnesium and cobalt efflux protein CorC [Candidatus Izimaplasma bacterium HR2]
MIPILLIIVILTGINALFAASEMALVSIKPSTMYQLKQKDTKNSKLLEKVTKDSTKYLSTIQVAITFSGFLSSAFAGSQLSVYLVDFLSGIGIDISNNIAMIIITVLLSFFTLVFGELVPKRVALSKSVKIALFSAPIIYVVMKVFAPIVWLLSISTRGVVRLLGIKAKQKNESVTEKEIRELIVYGHIEGLYQEQEKEMLERIFLFDDLNVDSIMTPIEEVVWINSSDMNDKMINQVIKSKFSRIPVYKDSKDNIQGVVIIKDILNQMYHTKDLNINIKDIIREPYIVINTLKINRLLLDMKQRKEHLAFIMEESNKVLGIVTLEDIIEEIVGEIYDEHDK